MKNILIVLILLCASAAQAQCPNCYPRTPYILPPPPRPQQYTVQPGVVPTIVGAPIRFLFAPRLVPARPRYILTPVR